MALIADGKEKSQVRIQQTWIPWELHSGLVQASVENSPLKNIQLDFHGSPWMKVQLNFLSQGLLSNLEGWQY